MMLWVKLLTRQLKYWGYPIQVVLSSISLHKQVTRIS